MTTPQKFVNFMQWIAITAVILVILVSIVFFSWWGMHEQFVFDDQRFDPVRWTTQSAENGNTCVRGDMVRDVRQRLLNPAMSKKQVTILLGRPDWEEDDQFEYELGVCLWAVHGLRLYFNDQGQLMHTSIIQH